MVKKTFDFYYDFGSPNAFLVHSVLNAIEKKTGYTAVYKPILLGGIFKLTNNQPPLLAFKEVKNKLAYQDIEFKRFIKAKDIEFCFNENFPVNTVRLMRAALFLENSALYKKFINKIFYHMWVLPKKLDEIEIFKKVLNQEGFAADKILEAIETDEVKTALITCTSLAVDRGVFGSPSMFVENEQFFGKDSLYDLENYIKTL